MSAAGRDFVTVFEIQGSDRANKRVYRKSDGSIGKDGSVDGGRYVAQTYPAPNAEALADLLRVVGADPRLVLSLGVFKDAGPDPFHVWSMGRIARKILGIDPKTTPPKVLAEKTKGWFEFKGLRVVARTKANMVHGSWMLKDRDLVRDMPQELAALGLDEWLAEEAALIPTFDVAAKAIVPSTSGRVLVDGEPWSDKASWHCYAQLSDPDEMARRLWPNILVKAFAVNARGTSCPLAFMRHAYSKADPSLRVTKRGTPWSIYDPTTFSPERLVFDGAPLIEGAGLSLAPPDVRVLNPGGGRVDVAAFADLPQEMRRPAAAKGVRTERKRTGEGVSVEFVTSATLDLDEELDTELGAKTVRQLWLENAGHVRCESPFRDSQSEAAYFNQHESDGTPFLFDTGASTKYTLSPACRAGPPPEAFFDALKAWVKGVGGTVETPEKAAVARLHIRNIFSACARHGWEQSAQDVVLEQLAEFMRTPYGMAKSKLSASFKKEAKAAARAAAAALNLDDGKDERPSLLERMNEKFAVVSIGGSTRVVEVDVYDPCLERRFIRIMGRADFELAHCNVMIKTPTRSDPDHETPLGTWWLHQAGRRQHLGGITLDATNRLGPQYLNTWRGFGVEPCDGDAKPFLDHIAMLCAGNAPGSAEYLTGWLARKVQHPGEQMEVAVVMRGDEGTGKGALGHTMCRIFGGHAMHISQGEHLVGKFNAHLMDCVFLFPDEAFFAGDPRHINVLKSLITERTIAIEKKFVDAVQGRNRLAIMMASNSDFVVPAGKDARRFFCVDVPGTHKGDRAYFKRYFDAVNDPAQLGAFLRHLLDRDLTDFEVRDFPQTEMLTDQKIATLDPTEKWLLNRLYLGRIPSVSTMDTNEDDLAVWVWPDWAMTTQLYDDYQEEMRKHGQPRFMLDAARFGKFLSRYYKSSRPRSRGRNPGYDLGDLDEARRAFTDYHRLHGFDWGGAVEKAEIKQGPRPTHSNGQGKSSEELAAEHWAAHPEDIPDIPL